MNKNTLTLNRRVEFRVLNREDVFPKQETRTRATQSPPAIRPFSSPKMPREPVGDRSDQRRVLIEEGRAVRVPLVENESCIGVL